MKPSSAADPGGQPRVKAIATASGAAGDGEHGRSLVDALETVGAVRRLTKVEPRIGIILGSGLGPLADEVDGVSIAYRDLPGMPVSSAPGHAGRLAVGYLDGHEVAMLQGRVHAYEGFTAAQCAYPVAVLKGLGVQSLVVTNACGGLDPKFRTGELMLQRDFINFTAKNPLIGPLADPALDRFPVMYDCYDPAYVEAARSAALRHGIMLREGVYLAMTGPSYATRAELRAFRVLGADAVGMSTVFEVIRARQLRMRVLGISAITDMAIPDNDEHATGDDVIRMAETIGDTFRRLVRAVLPEL
ncbi:MAG TPA: purine-nucleoside phosphorylase [Trueperaceae bacterium]|nr:purine-nucleoside phosphorylase [Trueperaceae bacterium]